MQGGMQVRLNRWTLVAIVLLAALLGSAIGGGTVAYLAPQLFSGRVPAVEPPAGDGHAGAAPSPASPGTVTGGEEAVVSATEQVVPAVVGVSVVQLQYDMFFRPVPVQGVGSGVIVDERGYILTNDHVVGGAESINVTLADGRQLEAERLWSATDLDLAVIRVKGSAFPVARMGDSDQVRVGETAIAIGNPLGLSFQRSVTAGIISALGRSITVSEDGGQRLMEDLIQTDASINPGNSGGPLVNLHGEVIGINTAKVSGAEALGFAIPINTARPILLDVIEKGRFVRPWLGVGVVDHLIAAQVGVEVKQGLLVSHVEPGGPADRAGMVQDDVMIELAGKAINTVADLRRLLFQREVGDTVAVVVLRNGRRLPFNVVLQEMPGEGG